MIAKIKEDGHGLTINTLPAYLARVDRNLLLRETEGHLVQVLMPPRRVSEGGVLGDIFIGIFQMSLRDLLHREAPAKVPEIPNVD